MPGKFEESDVFFAHVIQNADRAELFAGKPDDLAPRTSKLALERLHSLDRRVEMLLKKFFENVHQGFPATHYAHKDNIHASLT